MSLISEGAAVATGTWFYNPATGELARINVGPADTGGRRIESDLWLQPGAAVAGAHVHDHLVERFEVLAGEVAFQLPRHDSLTRPPAFVQAMLFGPLAALARRTGRDPLRPELQGPAAACIVPEPGEERFEALLARPLTKRPRKARLRQRP